MYLVDTNVLLRSVQEAHPMRPAAEASVAALLAQNETLCLFPQNIREFWNVGTRPADRNGLGMTHAAVDEAIERLENTFVLLEDGLPVYRAWREIVRTHLVSGVQVHDAYLVAGMRVHGISRILTFNTGDFTRYADLGIEAILPEVPEAEP